mgnify:CR=1 FL=1
MLHYTRPEAKKQSKKYLWEDTNFSLWSNLKNLCFHGRQSVRGIPKGERWERRLWRIQRPERVAAVGEGRRRTVAEDIRRAPQQDKRKKCWKKIIQFAFLLGRPESPRTMRKVLGDSLHTFSSVRKYDRPLSRKFLPHNVHVHSCKV